jgi:hypothetical protein
LSHVHAPLLHLLHMPPWNSYKVHACCPPCLSFACGLGESWWKSIQWCMHDQFKLDCLPLSVFKVKNSSNSKIKNIF